MNSVRTLCRLFLLLFSIHSYASSNSVVLSRAQALLSRFSVAAMPYCSGYHCYHQSMDTCERIGESQCRVLEIGNLGTYVSGHGNVVLRIPQGQYDYYCLADPQRHSQKISSELCWSLAPSANPPNSYWNPPQAVQEKYCRIRRLGCNSLGQVVFRVRKAYELEGNPYEAWWKNSPQSAGQIYKLCEHKNKAQNLGRLPQSMPYCINTVAKSCSNKSQSFACNHGGLCQVVHCSENSRWTWSTQQNLPLPNCEGAALSAYCYYWQYSIRRSAEARIMEGFIYNNTQHFCRSNKGLSKFWCYPSGPLYGGPGLRNEL